MGNKNNNNKLMVVSIGLGVLSAFLLLLVFFLIISLMSQKVANQKYNAQFLEIEKQMKEYKEQIESYKQQSLLMSLRGKNQQGKMKVVVAKKPIKVGKIISFDDLILKEVDPSFVPPSSANMPGVFIGKKAVTFINTGEPIIATSLERPLASKEEYDSLMKDYKSMMSEFQKVYREKRNLEDENQQLKYQIEDLKKQQ